MFKPRSAQQEILKYEGGFLGVSAVPGSGKTHTLSCLAANLILKDLVTDDQEVLIVTLVNSAVDNFSQRVAAFMNEFGLVPNIGYRVRTLHGLAHDIVREKPELAGLDNQFSIIDERNANDLLSSLVSNWVQQHPDFLAFYSHQNQDPSKKFIKDQWSNYLVSLASSFIKQAKDLEATPEIIQSQMEKRKYHHQLLEFGRDIYQQYRNILHMQSQVDFEDLVRLAYGILKTDHAYLERLRQKWPYILEDEAQDSSQVQEKILRLLAGENGNWVRVGDPNQAIYETFTTANPKYLQEFREEKKVAAQDLPNSGRSTRSIISLANHLVDWCQEIEHDTLNQALSEPFIQPAPPNDPQPNPKDQPKKIYLFNHPLNPEKEIDVIAKSVKDWVEDNSQKTIAVLVPRNERGAQVVQALNQIGVEAIEILKSSQATRHVANVLWKILDFIANTTNTKHLAEMFLAINKPLMKNDALRKSMNQFCAMITRKSKAEDLLFTDEIALQQAEDPVMTQIYELWNHFWNKFQAWHKAAILPISQFILVIGQQLFSEPTDLALCHKLSLLLGRMSTIHPEWSFREFAHELSLIASNRVKLYGFSDDDLRFDPNKYKGKPVVATIHKAKGLEWDRVYLLSVNNYDFPFNEEGDEYFAEKWFIRDHLNLEAEILSQLNILLEKNEKNNSSAQISAAERARQDIAAERMRVLYVGITRAREELVLTWNTGRKNNCHIAVPFAELVDFWEEKHATQQ